MSEKRTEMGSLIHDSCWLFLPAFLFAVTFDTDAQEACLTDPTYREPTNSDVMVTCGTNRMELNILMCGVYFSGFNSSLLALNGQFGKPDCMGTPDWIARPPVLKFNFSITEQALAVCSNKLQITQEVGSGLFSDYSNVQFVNVSGAVSSLDPSAGTITYRQQMLYMFSCRYPLQYLINNTRIGVAGVSLAVKDNNGSFISSLAMNLYGDSSYTSPLSIPDSGLNLKTRIYVEVKATNLTERFNVLLDRCYATPSPYPVNRSFFDLFVGCNHDAQTVMGVNGASQQARFSFEAFRFVEHRNQTVSTFYIHCATRLCERTYCSSLMQNCTVIGRRRRAVETAQGTSVTDVATVTSGPILTRLDKGDGVGQPAEESNLPLNRGAVMGVAVVSAVIGTLCIVTVAAICYWIYRTKRHKLEKCTLFH